MMEYTAPHCLNCKEMYIDEVHRHSLRYFQEVYTAPLYLDTRMEFAAPRFLTARRCALVAYTHPHHFQLEGDVHILHKSTSQETYTRGSTCVARTPPYLSPHAPRATRDHEARRPAAPERPSPPELTTTPLEGRGMGGGWGLVALACTNERSSKVSEDAARMVVDW